MGGYAAVDVGGTFTDVVVFEDGEIHARKVPTTAPDQSAGVISGLDGTGDGAVFLHGTTAGTNALLEGKGARVALVTTPGFEDVVEIGRQARPSLYDPFADRPDPLVERDWRLGHRDLESTLEALDRLGPEAVAVALVRSYDDPGPEKSLGTEIAGRLGVPVSVGARISPSFREYERIATTVLDAYLTPAVSGYLERLGASLGASSRLVMTSAGGLLPFERAVGLAGRLVLSGPAAGVVAASELARARGFELAVSFDMGGTSTDVCRIGQGSVPTGWGRRAGGRVNRVPSLPIHTIGAGGGSLAWVDEGGALRVGPRSAGAIPGPISYSRGGTVPTVTDANLALGRIPADLALGGMVDLDRVAAVRALGALGTSIGIDPAGVAAGVIEIVDSHMERAIRAVSVEEGADPRGGALVAFGGAGGLHAVRLARRLGMGKVLIPPLSGVFSALGLLLARPRIESTRTVLLPEGAAEALDAEINAGTARARSAFEQLGVGPLVENEARAGIRYRGQSHELEVPVTGGWQEIRAGFESAHQSRFGFDRPDEPVEMVDLTVEAIGRAPLTWADLPRLPEVPPPEMEPGPQGYGVVLRSRLGAGAEIAGPCLVVERDSVILVEEGAQALVHADGTIELDL